jgi:hypothetical protein
MSPVSLQPAGVSSVTGVSRPECPGAEVDIASVNQLVRSAILSGLCLDDPWRHAYLRDRWIGR